MRFHSILFDGHDSAEATPPREEPDCFGDLNLDQVLAAMIRGREAYNLAPFFYAPLRDIAAVHYRHDVLHDLEKESVATAVGAFAERMLAMRSCLSKAAKFYEVRQKQRALLDAAEIYCAAVTSLSEQLADENVSSRGLMAFRIYLATYLQSSAFQALATDTRARLSDLAAIRYAIQIKDNRVRVGPYEGEPDFSVEVEQTFAKFKQHEVQNYFTELFESEEMNHVEARILDLVVRLNPDVFQAIDVYCELHRSYLDPTIAAFDREVQFYVAYLEYMASFQTAGLPFCYPEVSNDSKACMVHEGFDLALATKLLPDRTPVVCNDFCLTDPERILIVSGPNQGGKTTFARMFGEMHYLASLGLPVPAQEARLFLPDRIYTHFEKEENLETLRGKLDDELVRIHDILGKAGSNSIVIMNESFSSTTLNDALFLSKEVMKRIVALDILCVCVTFIDELASLGPSTVSMVSLVDPANPATRTFEIVRRPADGLAYAAAIAEKYGLTYDLLRKRIAS